MQCTKILKIVNFLRKIYIFNTFAQNTDRGYTLESPRRGGSNIYSHPMFWGKNEKSKPHFHYLKVGFTRAYN